MSGHEKRKHIKKPSSDESEPDSEKYCKDITDRAIREETVLRNPNDSKSYSRIFVKKANINILESQLNSS